MCIRELLLNSTTTLGSCGTSILEGATFKEGIVERSFLVIFARPSKHSTGLLHLGLRVLDAFLSFWCMKEFGNGFDGVSFPHFLMSWRKLQLSPSRKLPVQLPLPTISKNSFYPLFCSLILNHGVSLTISISGFKILISCFLFDTSFNHRFHFVIIRSQLSSGESPGLQFQDSLGFFRFSYS